MQYLFYIVVTSIVSKKSMNNTFYISAYTGCNMKTWLYKISFSLRQLSLDKNTSYKTCATLNSATKILAIFYITIFVTCKTACQPTIRNFENF